MDRSHLCLTNIIKLLQNYYKPFFTKSLFRRYLFVCAGGVFHVIFIKYTALSPIMRTFDEVLTHDMQKRCAFSGGGNKKQLLQHLVVLRCGKQEIPLSMDIPVRRRGCAGVRAARARLPYIAMHAYKDRLLRAAGLIIMKPRPLMRAGVCMMCLYIRKELLLHGVLLVCAKGYDLRRDAAGQSVY
nr:hypothetical protein [Maliibacterium massiliense]